MTRQRAAIISFLTRQDAFLSARDLHRALGDGGGRPIGLATVYRTLRALAEAGEVDVLQSDAGEAIFRRCRRGDHHHHLVCRTCGASVELNDKVVESWVKRTAARHGFADVSHSVELFGTCPDCRGE